MKYFYKDLSLEIPDSVYLPREDSELLAEAIEKQELKGKKCLDMGCGSGLLSILIGKNDAIVTAADINLEAVKAARENAAHNKTELHAVYSDLFSNIKEKFDLIVFNPPYLPGEDSERKELAYYGGKDGRETIKRFLVQAKKFMKTGGKIFLLISTLTGEKEVTNIAHENGYIVKETARKKVPWEEIIVMEMRLSD